jgi:tetratricopeptide (TPR) repeat protein
VALLNLAWVHDLRGDDQAAAMLLEDAFARARPLANSELLARILKLRAGVSAKLGNWESAKSDYESTRRLREQSGDAEGVGDTECDLGNLELQRGELVRARAHLERAVAISRELGDQDTLQFSNLNLGLVEYLEGNSAPAYSIFSASLQVTARLRDPVLSSA